MGKRILPVAILALSWITGSRGEMAAQERPNQDSPKTIRKITFLGAKHIKEEELRSITGLQVGMAMNPKINMSGCRKIVDKYDEMGRTYSCCQLVKGGSPDETEVVYQITEGPKVKVHAIQFTGNRFVNSEQVLEKLKASSDWFHLPGGTYHRDMAESDVIQLIRYYRKLGFQDVKVALETQPSSDGSEVRLIFHIQEGTRSRPQEEKEKRSESRLP